MSEPLSDSASPPGDLRADGERPYHPKRPHKKSRTGCKSCKARKVKCDEARPTCRSCRLRKTECVYPSAAPATAASSSSRPTTAAVAEAPTHTLRTPPSSSSPAGQTSTDIDPNDTSSSRASSTELRVLSEPLFRPSIANDELDMRLLWFYTTATCGSFSIESGYHRPVETLMRTRLVQHAFETPFLMQSLFALASLHLQNLNQNIDPKRALTYRANSFEGYRRAIEEANPDTYPALVTNSLFLVVLSSQAFREPDSKDLYIIDWMIVWRGIGTMKMMGVKKLVEYGLDILFRRPPIDLGLAYLSIPNNLLFMISSIPADDDDYANTQAYYDALKYLGALYHSLNLGLNPIMNLRIITWLTFLPNNFVDMAKQLRPRAFVILAYYAIFLKIADTIWWLHGVGQRTLRDICRHLGPDWADVLKVPMLAINTNDHVELARLLLGNPEWVSPTRPGPEDEMLNEAITNLSWVDDLGRKVVFSGDSAFAVDECEGAVSHEQVWTL